MAIKRLATLDGTDKLRKGDLPLPLLPADAGADAAGAAAAALAAAATDATTKANAAQTAAALDATNKATAVQLAASGTAAAIAANTTAVLNRLRANLDNVNLLILGDSTGNATDEWVYLTSVWLGQQYPAYTVIYHLWDATGNAAYDTGAAGSATTLQTGTGANTLHVWNCSVSGVGTTYARGGRFSAAVLAVTPDHVLINYGHNEGTAAGGVNTDIWRSQMLALTETITESVPLVPVTMILQNPRGDGTPDPARRNRAYRDVAATRGFGIIDVHAAFLAQPSLTGLISGDNLHPTPAGSALWADEVKRAFTYSVDARPRYQGPSPLTIPAKNLLVNGDFANFPSPPTLPNWTAQNCAPAKRTDAGWVESANGYSVRLQATSAAQTLISQDIPAGLLSAVQGKYLTLAVRMNVPSGQTGTAGRPQISDNVGNYSATSSADLRDGWHWAIATRRIDPAATFVRVRIYVDTAASASADISVSAAYLVLGTLPRIAI